MLLSFTLDIFKKQIRFLKQFFLSRRMSTSAPNNSTNQDEIIKNIRKLFRPERKNSVNRQNNQRHTCFI